LSHQSDLKKGGSSVLFFSRSREKPRNKGELLKYTSASELERPDVELE